MLTHNCKLITSNSEKKSELRDINSELRIYNFQLQDINSHELGDINS